MPSEFHDLLVSELPRMKGYALILTRNRAAADDLLQETAIKAWRAREQFTLGTNFRAWIYRIIRNEHLSGCRRQKRAPIPMDDIAPEFFARDGFQENHVVAQEVFRSLDKLSKDQREALLLKAVSGLSYEEVSVALGCSIGTVKSRLWRARNELSKLMLGEERTAPRPGHRQSGHGDALLAPIAV